MIGTGSEVDHFALELTYNYGITQYKVGNDLRCLTPSGICVARMGNAWIVCNVCLQAQSTNKPCSPLSLPLHACGKTQLGLATGQPTGDNKRTKTTQESYWAFWPGLTAITCEYKSSKLLTSAAHTTCLLWSNIAASGALTSRFGFNFPTRL